MRHLLEIVILASVVVAVSALARKLGLLAPITLVVAGLGLSLIPHFPSVHLEPELVLIGILPPLLYVAALETSVPAFRYNLRPILLLAVGLVLFTAIVVGFVVHAIVPGVPLSICFALGAVVAPPDAVAATAVAKRIGLPRHLVTILEGESLINDATALVLLRVSLVAAAGSAVGFADIALDALVAAGGGMVVGAVGALVMGYLHKRTTDPLLDNALSLLTPFLVLLLAEAIDASAVVAVVVTGLALGHRLTTLMSAAARLQMDAFWRMTKFILEGMVFLLVGLQLREVIAELTLNATLVGVTAAVLGTVIVTRFAWIYATYLARLLPRVRQRSEVKPLRFPTAIAWAGMRGVVTLAAALALPQVLAGGRTYPRDLFIWLAFAAIVGTLVLQGLTLPAVARVLRIPPDDPKEDALAEAAVQHAASRAARDRLEAAAANGAPQPVVERLRKLADQRTNVAWERLGPPEQETPSRAYVRLRREMLNAEREVFRVARDEGRIPEDVLRRAQRDMDLEESMLERTGEL